MKEVKKSVKVTFTFTLIEQKYVQTHQLKKEKDEEKERDKYVSLKDIKGKVLISVVIPRHLLKKGYVSSYCIHGYVNVHQDLLFKVFLIDECRFKIWI